MGVAAAGVGFDWGLNVEGWVGLVGLVGAAALEVGWMIGLMVDAAAASFAVAAAGVLVVAAAAGLLLLDGAGAGRTVEESLLGLVTRGLREGRLVHHRMTWAEIG